MDKYSKYYLNSILSLKCPLYTYYVQNRFAEIDAISDVELKRFCSHEDAVNWLRSCALYDVFNMQNLRSFLTHQALSCYQIDRMDDHQVINEAAHLIINYPIVIEPQFKSSYLFFNGSRLYWIEENNLKSWQAVSGRKGYQSANFQNLKNKGPLPEGRWIVKQSEYQKMPDRNWIEMIAAELGRTKWPGGESSWGKNRIWIYPLKGTNTYGRKGFSIHGGDTPGSAGCIDLTENMPNFVKMFIGYGKDMILFVKYEK